MVEVVNNHRRLRFSRQETLRTVRRVIRGEKRPTEGITVVFVNRYFIRRMNREFLKRNYATDVISFQLEDGLGKEGEVYINLDRAKSQAREYRVSYGEEVNRLLIHGTLHLFGYEDSTKRKRERMRKREEYYLTRLKQRSRPHA